MPKCLKILLTLLFSVILLFGFTETANLVTGNWYQQFLPNIGNRNITDIFFLDSLTGWSVTNALNQNPDTTYVLKTTNGGDNWAIQYRKIQTGGGFSGYFRVYFLNQNTGYTCGVTGFDMTINGGINWTPVWTADTYVDMSILNVDTIWLVSSNSLTGGVFRTTNGGVNWTQQFSGGTQNPSHIYIFNARIGFMGNSSGAPNTYKTTNSGVNWSVTASGEGFTDMYFTDSLMGWKANGNMKKTTNGGLNWITQTLPFGGIIASSAMSKFSNINKDTIWGGGGFVGYPNSQLRGLLYRTTNGGDNWLFQIPDTSIHSGIYTNIKFVNKLNGWAYWPVSGIHTTLGGDPIWLTGIKQISSNVPSLYRLYQNYPNPFNPRTVIRYDIMSNVKGQMSLQKDGGQANVKLIIYDITGREVTALVNQQQRAGTYQVDFSGNGYSSGIYFYSLIIEGNIMDTKRMILLK